MDGHCKDCRHWVGAGWSANDFPIPDGHGFCDGIPGLSLLSREQGFPPIITPAALIPNDDPYESSSLVTHADFGCVLFEAKEAACSQ